MTAACLICGMNTSAPAPIDDGTVSESRHSHRPAVSTGAQAIGVSAAGSFAIGALAVGALAIGALAIGRLVIGRARIRRLEIDDLIVRKLQLPSDRELGR